MTYFHFLAAYRVSMHFPLCTWVLAEREYHNIRNSHQSSPRLCSVDRRYNTNTFSLCGSKLKSHQFCIVTSSTSESANLEESKYELECHQSPTKGRKAAAREPCFGVTITEGYDTRTKVIANILQIPIHCVVCIRCVACCSRYSTTGRYLRSAEATSHE